MRREIEGGTLEMWARVGDVGVLAVAGASSAALSAALIVALFPWLQRYALARLNARSSHVTPTAQGGGAAVILAALIVTWVLIVLGYARGSGAAVPSLPAIALVSLVVIAIAALGAIDDIRPLPVTPRLALQFLAAAALVWTVPAPMRALPFLPGVIESALLIVGLVWFINLTNFMDGIDGITVAEMVPISVTLAVLGVASVLPPPAGLIAMALAGALAGFWPWNRHVARLFLGDVGSLAIGALVGWLLILLAGRGYLAAALILPLYYLTDATLTLFQRWRRGEKLSDAHRSHHYQRATQVASGGTGRDVPEVTRAVFMANLVLAAIAVATVLVGARWFDVVALAAAAYVIHVLLAYMVPGVAQSSP